VSGSCECGCRLPSRSRCSGRSSSLRTRLPRALRAPAHEAAITGDGPHHVAELGAIDVACGASSCSPAVPPTCHKQRSRAVSSGQSRSLGDVIRPGARL
jgi:hypothetical protein